MTGRDPDSDAVFRDILASYGRSPAVTSKRMFGTQGLMVDDKLACFVVKTGELVVKLPPTTIERLTDAGLAEHMEMNGRTMRGWLLVPRSPDVDWFALADEAVTFVRALEQEKAAAQAP